MLRAKIHLEDLVRHRPCFDGRNIVIGNSWVQVLGAPALESTLTTFGNSRWLFAVRECAAGAVHDGRRSRHHDAGELHTYVAEFRAALAWPLDFSLLEVIRDSKGARLRITAGQPGTLPLYFTARHSEIALSWEFCELVRSGRHAIDFEIASHLLALDTLYTSRQVCTGVSMLTERSSVYFDDCGALLAYPPPAPAVHRDPSIQDEEVDATFEAMLDRSLARRHLAPRRCAFELSGGIDSTCVAAAAYRRGTAGKIQTGGIIVSGTSATEQMLRTRKIVTALDSADIRISVADHMPDPRPAPSDREFDQPLSEFYREAFQALWCHMAERGATELVSGLGGDELTPVYEDENSQGTRRRQKEPAAEILTPRAREAAQTHLPERAPPSPVPTTSLLAHACRSPYLARIGLWPVNPLCDSDLVHFCHRLPAHHRLGRRLLRRYSERALGIDLFPPGYTKETFESVLPDAMSRHRLEISAQLNESALADVGLVNLPAVHRLLDRVVATRDPRACGPLAFFLALERFARQIDS